MTKRSAHSYGNNHGTKNAGFTLIEIIVTIAIILLLLSVSFASIGASRNRTNDSNIKEVLGLMRVEAERIYSIDRNTSAICNGIVTSGLASELPTNTTFKCVDGAAGYGFEAVLSNGLFYCVDYFGRIRENAATSLPAGGANCTSGACDCR